MVRFTRWALAASLVVLPVIAQAKGILDGQSAAAFHDQKIPAECRGLISLVTDVGSEGLNDGAQLQ